MVNAGADRVFGRSRIEVGGEGLKTLASGGIRDGASGPRRDRLSQDRARVATAAARRVAPCAVGQSKGGR
jgi:hypothetical protein